MIKNKKMKNHKIKNARFFYYKSLFDNLDKTQFLLMSLKPFSIGNHKSQQIKKNFLENCLPVFKQLQLKSTGGSCLFFKIVNLEKNFFKTIDNKVLKKVDIFFYNNYFWSKNKIKNLDLQNINKKKLNNLVFYNLSNKLHNLFSPFFRIIVLLRLLQNY